MKLWPRMYVEKITEASKSWNFDLEFIKIIRYNFLIVMKAKRQRAK